VVASKMSRGTRFIVTDGGMHHHLAASGNLGQVVKRDYPVLAPARIGAGDVERSCVVGPLCTPLDTLARAVNLPPLQADDVVAVMQSGAYGLSASPTGFLSHPRPAEILVDDGRAIVIG
jgi:diaminopimelate decarboxylase